MASSIADKVGAFFKFFEAPQHWNIDILKRKAIDWETLDKPPVIGLRESKKIYYHSLTSFTESIIVITLGKGRIYKYNISTNEGSHLTDFPDKFAAISAETIINPLNGDLYIIGGQNDCFGIYNIELNKWNILCLNNQDDHTNAEKYDFNSNDNDMSQLHPKICDNMLYINGRNCLKKYDSINDIFIETSIDIKKPESDHQTKSIFNSNINEYIQFGSIVSGIYSWSRADLTNEVWSFCKQPVSNSNTQTNGNDGNSNGNGSANGNGNDNDNDVFQDIPLNIPDGNDADDDNDDDGDENKYNKDFEKDKNDPDPDDALPKYDDVDKVDAVDAVDVDPDAAVTDKVDKVAAVDVVVRDLDCSWRLIPDINLPSCYHTMILAHIAVYDNIYILIYTSPSSGSRNEIWFLDINDCTWYKCSLNNLSDIFPRFCLYITKNGIINAINFESNAKPKDDFWSNLNSNNDDSLGMSDDFVEKPPFHLILPLNDIVPNSLKNKRIQYYTDLINGYIIETIFNDDNDDIDIDHHNKIDNNVFIALRSFFTPFN